MKTKIMILLAAAMSARAACVTPSTYNVGSGQTYSTIQSAFNQLVTDCLTTPWTGSVTIHIFAGTYPEALSFGILTMGQTVTNRLIFQCDSGVVIDATGNGTALAIYQPHTTFQGYCEIKNATYYGFLDQADDVIIEGGCNPILASCTVPFSIHDNGANGIIPSGTVTGLTINNLLLYGHPSDSAVNLTNVLAPCLMSNIKMSTNFRGILVGSPNCTIHDVENNGAGYTSSNFAVDFAGSGTGGVAYNIFSYNGRYGMETNASSTGGVFYNCISVNEIFGANSDNSATGGYYNSIFYGESSYMTLLTSGIIFKNNVVVVPSGSMGPNAITGVVMDYNDYYLLPGATAVGQWNGSNQANLAAWKAATSQDAHSISANPQFFSAGSTSTPTLVNNAYQFPLSSPLLDAGTTIGGFSTDWNGLTRPNGAAWDIGPFERPHTSPAYMSRSVPGALDEYFHREHGAPGWMREKFYAAIVAPVPGKKGAQ